MQANKAQNKVDQARDAQASTVDQMLQMRKGGPGYEQDPKYQELQEALTKSQAQDAKWSRRLSPDADLPSAGMRTLDVLASKRRSDPFSYFDDADAAMDILGIDKPDEAMRDRLSSQAATAISNAEISLRDDQALVNSVHKGNTTFAGAGEATNVPGRIARNTIGINKLKRFAFRRFLDLGDGQ